MKTTKKTVEMIAAFEGYRDRAYLCPSGVWTIGYGTTRYPDGRAVRAGDSCTMAQALGYKAHDLARFEKNVMKFHERYKWTQNEFDALVSFAYNVGSVDGLTKDGTRSKEQIAQAIPLYDKGRDKNKNLVVLAGLVRRREAERKLFLTPDGPAPQNTAAPPGAATAPANGIDALAREVIAGKWGVNPDRARRLTAAGHDAAVVQRRVNELLKK